MLKKEPRYKPIAVDPDVWEIIRALADKEDRSIRSYMRSHFFKIKEDNLNNKHEISD